MVLRCRGKKWMRESRFGSAPDLISKGRPRGGVKAHI